MNRSSFDAWLQNVHRTREEEISCTECFDLVSHYVDLEISGRDVATELPQMKHHLLQCRACREEYESLRDLARLEDQGDLPSTDELRNSIG